MGIFPQGRFGETGMGLGYRGLGEMDGTGVALRRVSLGTWGGGPSIGNVENLLKEGSGYEHFSVSELS
jgi:hypothetical protein